MLDDRNVDPDPHLADLATWTYDNNFTGGGALLGDERGTVAVPAAAAPARHPGSPHGHEWIDPDADVARRSIADRVRVIRSL